MISNFLFKICTPGQRVRWTWLCRNSDGTSRYLNLLLDIFIARAYTKKLTAINCLPIFLIQKIQPNNGNLQTVVLVRKVAGEKVGNDPLIVAPLGLSLVSGLTRNLHTDNSYVRVYKLDSKILIIYIYIDVYI